MDMIMNLLPAQLDPNFINFAPSLSEAPWVDPRPCDRFENSWTVWSAPRIQTVFWSARWSAPPRGLGQAHSVRRPCVQLNCTSYLEQFTNYHSNSIHYQHFSTTPQDSSFLRQHHRQLTVTIRAYDSNFCFDIWRVTNADYLLTYLIRVY